MQFLLYSIYASLNMVTSGVKFLEGDQIARSTVPTEN